MIRKAPSYDPRSLELLDEPGGVAPEEVAGLGGNYPVWTENKAKFIHRYLRYFVFVTHHGTYIDGFAGPQEENHGHMWTAKLVLESEPKFLRNFFLCDKNVKQAKRLEELKAAQPPNKKGYPSRAITVYHGDFNMMVDEVLASGVVTEKEATFALLDQRTFECDWKTVVKLATHKKVGNKIELLYFLPIKWLHRSISGLQKPEAKLDRWWGHNSWRQLANASSDSITKAFSDRVKSEFGYGHVFSWPIYANENGGGAVMYQLVHASDHAEAPKLMSRAYRNANPVRIIQRFGRIDRIGSPNSQIQLVNFWPNIELEEYINLEQRVSGRMVLLDISATGEENLIEQQSGNPMNDLEYRRKQLLKLQDAVIDLEDLSTGVAITDLTLTDFRIDLAQFLKAHPGKLEGMPLGACAIATSIDADIPPGVVFCLRAEGTAAEKASVASIDPSYPLAPHYLVHIGDDGTVLLPYTQGKRILDRLKRLSLGRDLPDATACARHDKATKEGEDMRHAQRQLAAAVSSVVGKSEERAVASLFSPGGTHAMKGEFAGSNDFEVVAYLVVLPTFDGKVTQP